MKKLFAILILILVGTISISVSADTSGVCGTNQNAIWMLDDYGVFTVSGKGEIPNFVQSNIPWKDVMSQIKTVVIEEGITSIGGTSFYQCKSLKSITIPEGITSIGTSAFSGCTSLGNIKFPTSLEFVGKSAFYNCISMTRLEIPENVKVLENWAFNSCTNVSEINWKAVNVQDMSESSRAFPNLGNNTNGVNVTFANGVLRVPAYAFYGNPNVSTITLPDTLESIGIYAFDLTGFYSDSSNWENNVLYIGKNLIKAKSLSGEYTVKEGTRLVCEQAFLGCKSLTGISIPDSVEIIEEQAFYNCTGLRKITLPFIGKTREDEAVFKYIFGDELPSSLSSVTVTNAQSICDFAFYGCGQLTDVTIKGNTSKIGSYAFYGCEQLGSISIPDSVVYVGEQAFSETEFYNNNSNWENDVLYVGKILVEVKDIASGEVSIKDNTKCIADDAFYNCLNMSGVIIPETVTHIGNRAFYNCDSLAELTIPDGVRDIGVFAFAYCDKLENVKMSESVKNIGNFAFSNCTKLKKVPENIDGVGESVFSYCQELSDVSVENNTTYRMYYSCDGLRYVKVNSGVTTIAPYTFSECVGIDTVIIPKSVTHIETGAFEDCVSLKTVKYEGNSTEWENLKIALKNEHLYFANVTYNSPVPEDIIYVNVEALNGNFVVTPKGVPLYSEIVFVCYKNKQLCYVENVPYVGSEITFTPDTEYDKVKVLVWKTMDSMEPVCDYKDVNIFKR